MIEKVYKKDVPQILSTPSFWEHSFLPITKHRLYAHYQNPNCDDDDVILLLAYLNNELVGYIGVFIDYIQIKGGEQKIGWLSTWWVHPKTKGSGIGRNLLNTMYDCQHGKIGVSQFTPSAKRVYIKSNYFIPLKKNAGYKFVFRSNFNVVLPLISSKFNSVKPLLTLIDTIANLLVEPKIKIQSYYNHRKLRNLKISYVNVIDLRLENFIKLHSIHHLSPKKADFFQWLMAYPWVLEAPVNNLNISNRYEFSMSARHFHIYLLEIQKKDNDLIGFIVIQRKNTLLKVLFAYYGSNNAKHISRVILQHAFKLGIKELVCYDESINKYLKFSYTYLYKRNKTKESIISKVFQENDYSSYELNFGDGDCSFA